jgi:alkylation response protein AidB-like acyl-CoA dehydrogenase
VNLIPGQYAKAVRLEQLLGDPGTAENLLSFSNAILWDEREEFPRPALERLHRVRLHHVYVPKSLGGQFESCESFISFVRVVARRNMSVAVSYSTMVWTMLAWLGGNPVQQRKIAGALLNDGEFPCLAYSEESHGSDLLANETSAHADENGRYELNGEKWPINRATRSQWVVLLARTSAGSHLRNHSLFIFDKGQLDPHKFEHLPRVKTHGLRGCDISGIRFHDCLLPIDSRIGREGDGLDLALKGFQITRTFCTGLSLGVGDSALRIVAQFVNHRRLYGSRAADLPHARDSLANAYLSLLIAECASIAAARSLHLFPAQSCTSSPIAKVQVARLVDFAMPQLAAILGARSYLRQGHAYGMFQKFLRDGAIIAMFDGSSIVCLDRLASELPKLCRPRSEDPTEDAVTALFDLRHPLPALAFEGFTILGRGEDVVVQSLPLLRKKVASLSPDKHCNISTLRELNIRVRRLQEAVTQLQVQVQSSLTAREEKGSAARFGMAERYCALHNAICCLGFWLLNRNHLGSFVARGEWLAAALGRQGETIFRCGTLSPRLTNSLCSEMFEQTDHAQMYSLIPWPLPKPGQHEQAPACALFELSAEDPSTAHPSSSTPFCATQNHTLQPFCTSS